MQPQTVHTAYDDAQIAIQTQTIRYFAKKLKTHTVITQLALGLVLTGAFIMLVALLPIRRLIAKLPAGPMRNRWYAMLVMIVLFFIGYLAYTKVFWNNHSRPIDLIVPAIFFLGACFVWLTAALSLQTTSDVMRITLLEHESITDSLTGVFNRRYLDHRLTEDVATAHRYKLALSVLMIDIDHFKHVNDRFGHQAGDLVLASLGEIISKVLRESDYVARYGGEEFLVVALYTPLPDAAELAERLHVQAESIGLSLPDQADGLKVTVSIGVASLGGDIDSSERLIQVADANLYRAKEAGRNRIDTGTPGI